MSLGFRSFGSSRVRRPILAALVLTLATMFTAASVGDSFARLGGGGSFGSRGSRTTSAPPSTYTAPRPSPLAPTAGGMNPGFAAQRPGFFSGGFGRGLLGGLVGAGLFGMLFGNGFGGGLGGLSSVFGLILQLGLLYLAFRLVMGWFRRRQPAYGGNAAFEQAQPAGAAFGGGGSGPGTGAPRGTPITIAPEDFTRFERRLGEIQAVYSAEDLNGLRRLATPEMTEHFAAELASNNRQGVVNRLADVRLLQGDLAEAWREGSSEYATVAMRFSLLDATVERASGRVVAGSSTAPQTVTELWTFVRSSGTGSDNWILSAIQQG